MARIDPHRVTAATPMPFPVPSAEEDVASRQEKTGVDGNGDLGSQAFTCELERGRSFALTKALAGWRTAVRTAQLMIGVPDYETYIAHRQQHHAGDPVMTPADFFRSRQDARYKRGSSRCC